MIDGKIAFPPLCRKNGETCGMQRVKGRCVEDPDYGAETTVAPSRCWKIKPELPRRVKIDAKTLRRFKYFFKLFFQNKNTIKKSRNFFFIFVFKKNITVCSTYYVLYFLTKWQLAG